MRTEIERAETVISAICAEIREAKADLAEWQAYKQRLEGVRLPQPRRKIRGDDEE